MTHGESTERTQSDISYKSRIIDINEIFHKGNKEIFHETRKALLDVFEKEKNETNISLAKLLTSIGKYRQKEYLSHFFIDNIEIIKNIENIRDILDPSLHPFLQEEYVGNNREIKVSNSDNNFQGYVSSILYDSFYQSYLYKDIIKTKETQQTLEERMYFWKKISILLLYDNKIKGRHITLSSLKKMLYNPPLILEKKLEHISKFMKDHQKAKLQGQAIGLALESGDEKQLEKKLKCMSIFIKENQEMWLNGTMIGLALRSGNESKLKKHLDGYVKLLNSIKQIFHQKGIQEILDTDNAFQINTLTKYMFRLDRVTRNKYLHWLSMIDFEKIYLVLSIYKYKREEPELYQKLLSSINNIGEESELHQKLLLNIHDIGETEQRQLIRNTGGDLYHTVEIMIESDLKEDVDQRFIFLMIFIFTGYRYIGYNQIARLHNILEGREKGHSKDSSLDSPIFVGSKVTGGDRISTNEYEYFGENDKTNLKNYIDNLGGYIEEDDFETLYQTLHSLYPQKDVLEMFKKGYEPSGDNIDTFINKVLQIIDSY